MFTHVEIQYANVHQLDDTIAVDFRIRDSEVSQKWANLLSIAIKKYPIDDPGRFYGFYDRQELISRALDKINQTIDRINDHQNIIDRHLGNILDQDTLNYLHHIFEIYHGLLDDQNSDFWNSAPDTVRKALADLNIQVHECESVARNLVPTPAHAVTWYKMPKITKLQDDDYKLFEIGSRTGHIYMMYTEIGKTLEHLSQDQDRYVSDSAFKPFRHISADFIVNYYDDDPAAMISKYDNMETYYRANEKFFIDRGLQWGHPYLFPGLIPVAEIETGSNDLINEIKTRQWVKSIKIT
jgi:hypothetical protein